MASSLLSVAFATVVIATVGAQSRQVDVVVRAGEYVERYYERAQSLLATEVMVATLWSMQNAFLDDVPVDKIKDFQLKLQEFLTTRKDAVLGKIRDKGAIDDDITNDLKAAVGEFKTSYR